MQRVAGSRQGTSTAEIEWGHLGWLWDHWEFHGASSSLPAVLLWGFAGLWWETLAQGLSTALAKQDCSCSGFVPNRAAEEVEGMRQEKREMCICCRRMGWCCWTSICCELRGPGRRLGEGIGSCCLETPGCHLMFGSPVTAAAPWAPQPPGMLPTQPGSTVPGKLGLQGK